MLYLVRHGQTEFNAARRVQGALDSALTPLGVAQGRALGRLLAGLIGDPADWRLVASPLGRTLHTAGLIAEACGFTGPPILEPRVREVSLGEWDGLSEANLDAVLPEHVPYAERYFHGPGGETYEGMTARIADWLAEVAATPDIRRIVVSHGLAGRIIRGLYADMPRKTMLGLPVPQDAVFRLHDGRIERIDVTEAVA